MKKMEIIKKLAQGRGQQSKKAFPDLVQIPVIPKEATTHANCFGMSKHIIKELTGMIRQGTELITSAQGGVG